MSDIFFSEDENSDKLMIWSEYEHVIDLTTRWEKICKYVIGTWLSLYY